MKQSQFCIIMAHLYIVLVWVGEGDCYRWLMLGSALLWIAFSWREALKEQQ